jgi:hypothetical protein
MSIVRIEALRALGALIELRIPELKGHVCFDVPPGEYEHVPNLSIEPSKWGFEPEQADEHATLPGNVVVWNVGEHSCAMVLSIVAANKTQRSVIEAKVLDLFLGYRHPLTDIPTPGVLVIPVTACHHLDRWIASFELESDEWSNNTLDRRYESRIVIAAHIPALTVQTPVYTLNELLLGITHDLDSTFTPATATPPAVELVTINEDGTITTAA